MAAGEGSRLAADGVLEPKPLVAIGGIPQIVRLARSLYALGCAPVTCLIREDLSPRLKQLTSDYMDLADLQCVPARTPSSLHTLALGLEGAPAEPVFCTMVDTVMRPTDWLRVYDGCRRALLDGAAGAVAVTPYTGGEGSLYVVLDTAGQIRELRDGPLSALVTGGVYALAPSAQSVAREARSVGVSRVRNFLRQLLALGFRLDSVQVECIVDLDRASDLRRAAQVLHAPLSVLKA